MFEADGLDFVRADVFGRAEVACFGEDVSMEDRYVGAGEVGFWWRPSTFWVTM